MKEQGCGRCGKRRMVVSSPDAPSRKGEGRRGVAEEGRAFLKLGCVMFCNILWGFSSEKPPAWHLFLTQIYGPFGDHTAIGFLQFSILLSGI